MRAAEEGLPLFMRDYSSSAFDDVVPLDGRDYVYDEVAQKSIWRSTNYIPSYAPTAHNDQRKSDERYLCAAPR